MAIEAGKEYNPDTAKDLRERRFCFEAAGELFRYTLQVPEYILARLSSEVTGQLQEYMEGYCLQVLTAAIKGGYWDTDSGRKAMATDVGTHLKNYLWERFSISQEQAGQSCWQTAPSLQEIPKL